MADRKRKRQEYREERRGKGRPHAGGRTGAAARPVWPIQRGWKVYTADRATLGSVGDVLEGEDFFPVSGGFLLRRYTVYVPTRFVRAAGDGLINLRVTKSQALRWRQPPVARRPARTGAEEADVLTTAPPAPRRAATAERGVPATAPAAPRMQQATPLPHSAVAAPSATQPVEQGPRTAAAIPAAAQASQVPVVPSPDSGTVGRGSDATADEMREAALHRFDERLEALARSEGADPAEAPARDTPKVEG